MPRCAAASAYAFRETDSDGNLRLMSAADAWSVRLFHSRARNIACRVQLKRNSSRCGKEEFKPQCFQRSFKRVGDSRAVKQTDKDIKWRRDIIKLLQPPDTHWKGVGCVNLCQLDGFAGLKQLALNPQVKVHLVFHGCPRDVPMKVIQGGFHNLCRRNDGWFGQGYALAAC